MKLYTKTGDDGTTGLFGGKRVAKNALTVETYGSVDELNCAVGLAQSACEHAELKDILRRTQMDLFELGTDLATPQDGHASVPRIYGEHIEALERQIDGVWERLPAMKYFVLPGGSELASRLHLARAICRRVERLCVSMARDQAINPHAVVYLNRLSDLLFTIARRANQLDGVDEVPWIGGIG